VVVYVCNSSTQSLRQEDWEFKASMDYTERLGWKKEREEENEKKKERRQNPLSFILSLVTLLACEIKCY
jgi:hypothetical protein